jgi:hypothetical protein
LKHCDRNKAVCLPNPFAGVADDVDVVDAVDMNMIGMYFAVDVYSQADTLL